MLEILNYEFMQRAIIGGILIGISCSLIGVFLVLKRLSLLGDGLAHATFGGIGVGLLFNLNPMITAMFFAIVASLGIDKLINKVKIHGDSAIAVVLGFGMALALIIIGIADEFNYNLFSYLFGSILTITELDLYILGGILVVEILFFVLFYKKNGLFII